MLLFLNLYLRSISISKYKLSGSAQILIAEKIEKTKKRCIYKYTIPT